MKIVSLVSKPNYTSAQIDKLNQISRFTSYDCEGLKMNETLKIIRGCEAIIVGASGVNKLSRDILLKSPNLQLISVLGSGVDFIDTVAASELNIKVMTVVGTNSQSVAEHAWGLALSLSKRITESANSVKKGDTSFDSFLGTELYGKTIGIIGYGQIGRRVARIAEAFNMNILVYNRSKKDAKANYVDLDLLLESSDLIVIALPLTDDTQCLISREKLKLIKDKGILVNISRQSIIEESALEEILIQGKLLGLGMELDVGATPSKALIESPNVVITPHNGFYTEESINSSTETAVNNVLSFFNQ